MEKFKPGERFNKFQAKKKEYEEKKKRKGVPTFGAISAGASKGLNAGVTAGNMGLVAPKAMKAPKLRGKRKAEKKRKEHSEEAIKGMREFVDEEAKEKGKKGKKKTLRSPEAVVKSEQNASDKYKKKKKNWIAGAIKKPGALRSELGVKEGKKIPKSTLAKAAKKPGVEGKRARLAETLKGLRKSKMEKKCKTCGK